MGLGHVTICNTRFAIIKVMAIFRCLVVIVIRFQNILESGRLVAFSVTLQLSTALIADSSMGLLHITVYDTPFIKEEIIQHRLIEGIGFML